MIPLIILQSRWCNPAHFRVRSQLATAASIPLGHVTVDVLFVSPESLILSTELLYLGAAASHADISRMADKLEDNISSIFYQSPYFQSYSRFQLGNLTISFEANRAKAPNAPSGPITETGITPRGLCYSAMVIEIF